MRRVNVGTLPAHCKYAVEVPLSKVINKKPPVEAGDIIAWASSAINPLDRCTTPTVDFKIKLHLEASLQASFSGKHHTQSR